MSVRRVSINKENVFGENLKNSQNCTCSNTKNPHHKHTSPKYGLKDSLIKNLHGQESPINNCQQRNSYKNRIHNKSCSKDNYFISPVKTYIQREGGERHSLNSRFSSFKNSTLNQAENFKEYN